MGYIKEVDAVLQALADPNRRIMLEVLRSGPATVTELAGMLPIARPGVSHTFACCGKRDLSKTAQMPSGGSTGCAWSRWPSWTRGSAAIGSSGNSVWMLYTLK